MTNLDEIKISDGTEILSLNSFSNNNKETFVGEDVSDKKVIDFGLTEIEEEETLSNLRYDISKIDSIQYASKDDFFPDVILKKLNTEQNSNKVSQGIPIEDEKTEKYPQKNNINPDDNVDSLEISDVAEVNDEEFENDLVNQLVNQIDKDKDKVLSPTKLQLYDIDKSLKDDVFLSESEDKTEKKDDEEMFGVKKSEVFYSIDKKIYSNRAESSMDIKKVKGLKRGVMLPFLVVISSIAFLFIAIPILSYYFNKNSKTSLEDNYIKDVSILEKIAKQKEEEARLAKLKLEEERKNLEFEKGKIENRINEEYSRAIEEIHRDFNRRLDELVKSGLPKNQIETLKGKLEEEKQVALAKARRERDLKIKEQEKILSEKDKNLKESEDKLKKALENKEYEVTKITSDLQQKLKEQDLEKQNIALKLKELSETGKKVKEFNQMIYQLINSAITDFKNNNKDQSLTKLNNIVKYYESRLDFINANDDLKTKMGTDLLMVESITRLINESKINSGFSEDYAKIVDKYKRISTYYKEAENNYGQKNYQKSNELYNKILSEFEEINFSYSKIKDIETKLQNNRALTYYNSALKNMQEQKYDIALTELSTIIKETPSSDYANMALNDIVKLADALSIGTRVKESDAKARELFNKGTTLSKNGQYKEAILLFNQVITDYPYSTLTKEALKNSIDLSNLVSNEEFKRFSQALGEKFKEDYIKFIDAYKKADYKLARESYISALKNHFGRYTNETIGEFMDAEEKYIASLLSSNKLSSDKDVNKQIEELKLKLESQYSNEIKNRDNKITDYQNEISKLKANYEDEKKKIEDNYKKLITDASIKSKDEEVVKLKSFYENELKSKENEYLNKIKDIETKNAELVNKLGDTKAIDEIKKELAKKTTELETKNLELTKKASELEAKNKELIGKLGDTKAIDEIKKDLAKKEEQLNKEKADADKIKEDLLSITKKFNELKEKIKGDEEQLLKNYHIELAEKDNALNREKEKSTKLSNDLTDITNRFNELQDKNKKEQGKNVDILNKQLIELDKKFNDLSGLYNDAVKNREQEKQRLKNEYDELLEQEKQKLKEEFSKQLQNLKNERTVDKEIEKNKKDLEKVELKNKFVARIIELMDESVTFQFLAPDFTVKVKKGDKLKIVRFISKTNEEIEIGTIELTFSDKNSLFARGKIISLQKNQSIQVNDLLKN